MKRDVRISNNAALSSDAEIYNFCPSAMHTLGSDMWRINGDVRLAAVATWAHAALHVMVPPIMSRQFDWFVDQFRRPDPSQPMDVAVTAIDVGKRLHVCPLERQ